MVATAFISMWISNTATAAMMYPIAMALGQLFGEGAPGGPHSHLPLPRARVRRLDRRHGHAHRHAAQPDLRRGVEGTARPADRFCPLPAHRRALRASCWCRSAGPCSATWSTRATPCWARPPSMRWRSGARGSASSRAASGPPSWCSASPRSPGSFASRRNSAACPIPGLTALAPGLSDAAIGLTGALALFLIPAQRR